MSGVGLFTLLMHLVVGNNYTPDKLELKTVTLVCKDIMYTFSKDSYKYIGISTGRKNYLTNYENSDTLQKEIDSQCKN